MLVEGQVGLQKLSNGVNHPFAMSKEGAIITSLSTPKNTESTVNGDFYHAANLGGTPVTTQAGLSATTPALTLYNPVGSGVYLVLNRVNITLTASPAAACGFMLAYNTSNAAAPATTTLATVSSGLIGSTKQPAGQCYRIATLAAAPVCIRTFGGTSGAAAISGIELTDDIEGEIVIIPGVAISIQSTSAASIIASMSWKEVGM